jgi:hypothetical protein
MSNISEMAALIQARAEAVNAKRDTDYIAASEDFISKAGDHVSELDAVIAEQAVKAAAQQLAHDDNFVASKQSMDAKIANFESNVDPAKVDSLSEQVAAILAADAILDNSILTFKSDQGAILAALEIAIGNEADVIDGMGLGEGGDGEEEEEG